MLGRLKALRWKVLALAVIGLAAVSGLGVWGAAVHTADPQYCAGCHAMEPFHDAWSKGAHADIGCLECHAAPDEVPSAGTTLAGVRQRLSYVVGSWRGFMPQGLVEDENCTRCHSSTDVADATVDFHGIAFSHALHDGDMGRGLDLRCTSCHTKVGDDSHVDVAPETCYSCHLRRPADLQVPGEHIPVPAKDCLACHEQTFRNNARAAEIHESVLLDALECRRCHGDMVHGTPGHIASERCRRCHFSELPDIFNAEVPQLETLRLRRIRIECKDDCDRCHFRESRFDARAEAPQLHDKHVGDLKVECAECHGMPEHRAADNSGESGTACDECHGPVHAAQRGGFSGVAGAEATDAGFPEFHSRIRCQFCHLSPIHVTQAAEADVEPIPPEHACRTCHAGADEGDFGNLPAKWRRGNEQSVAALERFLADAGGAVEDSREGRDRDEARRLLERANGRLDLFVQRRTGFHNLALARHVLSTVATDARKAVVRAGAKDRVPALVEPTAHLPQDCGRCHFAPAEGLELAGRLFSHQRHLAKPGIACARCHTDDPHPTALTPSSEACSSCHHAIENRDRCATCHDIQHAMYRGEWLTGVDEVANVMAQEVHCVGCHFPDTAQLHPLRPDRETCHRCHEQDVGALLDDWKAIVARSADRLENALAVLEPRSGELTSEQRRTLEMAQHVLADVRRDRSGGIHNPTGVDGALNRYAEAIERMARR